jgi:uncharacterized membrane protein
VTQVLVLIHVFGAIVWTGGHLVLALVVLPRALRNDDARLVQEFEQGFEPLAIPSLLAQVASGVWLALRVKPADVAWTRVTAFPVSHIAIKLLLLLAILALAVHAKRRVLPRLEAGELRAYAGHARAVTLLSVALVVVGVGLSTGGFF